MIFKKVLVYKRAHFRRVSNLSCKSCIYYNSVQIDCYNLVCQELREILGIRFSSLFKTDYVVCYLRRN